MTGLRVLLADPLPHDPAEALTNLSLELGRIDTIICRGRTHPAVKTWAEAIRGVTLVSIPGDQPPELTLERYGYDLTLSEQARR